MTSLKESQSPLSFSMDTATPPANLVSRRTLIKVGWVVPTVVALELSGVKLALATSLNTSCSAGFWPNTTTTPWPTPYVKDGPNATTVGGVFSVPSSYTNTDPSTTLSVAMDTWTSASIDNGARALIRQGAASLLNYAEFGYAFSNVWTTFEITTKVNAALASNDKTTITDLIAALTAVNDPSKTCGLPK